MAKVIIVGHGGYGTAVKNCLGMLLGDTPGIFYVDFNREDNLDTLKQKLYAAMECCGEDKILFACDLTGGSPFKQCAVICAEKPGHIAVAGLNIAACAEMVYNLDMSVEELADMALETARMSMLRFPEKQE
jgi:PTS system N-acetylgalactosamine-specific IIA component